MNTFIIDIDGTIMTAKKRKNGAFDYPNAQPNYDVINKINQLYVEGHKIILFTARGMKTFNKDVNAIKKFHEPILIRWLNEYKLNYHELIFGKPWGEKPIYLDDRSLSLKSFINNKSCLFENLIKIENLI